MRKKNLSKILTTGTLKQRALLLAEEIAQGKYGTEETVGEDKALLTTEEFRELVNSFKEPKELALYNKFKKADETVTNALLNLQGLTQEILSLKSTIRGYVLLWNALENSELMANFILGEIEEEQRIEIAKKVKRNINFLMADVEADVEGFLDFNTTHSTEKETNLYKYIQETREATKQQIIKFISWREAIVNYMDETGFKVKTYQNLIKKMTDKVTKPAVVLSKYQTNDTMFLDDPNPFLDKFKHIYNSTVDTGKLVVNDEVKEWFKLNFLDDE